MSEGSMQMAHGVSRGLQTELLSCGVFAGTRWARCPLRVVEEAIVRASHPERGNFYTVACSAHKGRHWGSPMRPKGARTLPARPVDFPLSDAARSQSSIPKKVLEGHALQFGSCRRGPPSVGRVCSTVQVFPRAATLPPSIAWVSTLPQIDRQSFFFCPSSHQRHLRGHPSRFCNLVLGRRLKAPL